MSEPQFDPTNVGVWGDTDTFEVTAERIVEYARATNDPIEPHTSGAVAPPVFAIVPVFNSLIPASLAVAPAELIPYLVHGEQDFRFHRQIVPGMTLVSRSKPIGYEGKSSGTRGTVYVECRTTDGELVNEQYVTFFFRKFDAGVKVGELGPGHAFDERLRVAGPVAKVVQHIDEDQTFRYSPAAGDPMPIHLDEEIAKLSGLPGIIAHGLCTMAFTSWAGINELAGGRPDRLRRLAVRFSKPVLPGQDIATEFFRAGSRDGVTSYAYETTVGEDKVITDGLAEFAD
jgi:acyl dehydratase